MFSTICDSHSKRYIYTHTCIVCMCEPAKWEKWPSRSCSQEKKENLFHILHECDGRGRGTTMCAQCIHRKSVYTWTKSINSTHSRFAMRADCIRQGYIYTNLISLMYIYTRVYRWMCEYKVTLLSRRRCSDGIQ